MRTTVPQCQCMMSFKSGPAAFIQFTKTGFSALLDGVAVDVGRKYGFAHLIPMILPLFSVLFKTTFMQLPVLQLIRISNHAQT